MRKYWCRKQSAGSKEKAYIIMADFEKDRAFWFKVHPDVPFEIDDTDLRSFRIRSRNYSSLYQPITKKQFLCSRIAGKFIE